MPIILISVDSENTNMTEFDNMEHVIVDVVLESTDPRSKAIGDLLGKKMVFINRLVLNRLDDRGDNESDEDAMVRIQSAVNMIRQMNVRNGMIISHHSLLNSWVETTIEDEWDVIAMN